MEKKLIAEINIEDKEITHFASFSLQQAFNEHHYFELRFNHDQMGAPGLISLDDSRDFVGKTLTASFGHSPEAMQNFVGLVSKVELSQSHGYHGVLIVSGYSPTILIDRGPDLGSYLDKDLNEIVKLATKDTPANDLKVVANASRTSSIDYIIQYKESDFAFLNRLSAEYHEWFFYDGKQLNFGKPNTQKEIALFYGRDVQEMQYAMEIAPIKNKRFSYNPKQDEMLQSESTGKVDGIPDLSHAVKASNLTFSKTFNQPSLIRVDNSSDISSHVENEEKANVSELLKVTAKGDNAGLSIGGIAEITMSIRKELAFTSESLGKFLITSIKHYIDENGKYHNTFEGKIATTERLLVKKFEKPQPDMQLADVIDNNDPQGQGRIKVKFKWECLTNDVTEWLRVVTPSAGIGDRGNNRGYFAIPEIDDQVMIAFEEGNIARPVVMGSVYHSSSVDSSPLIKNHLKSIITRSGHLVEFDDDANSQGIKITDIHNNIIHIDTKGNNITITALENMTLNCKNMQINVGENMDVSVGKNISESAGENITSSANQDIIQTAGKDINISATGDMRETANNKTELVEKAYTRSAQDSTQYAEKVTIFSTKENMLLESSEKTVEINSAEKSNLF
ncbi:type VI secretion system secreted protein VgrG [Pedobacter sp. W3I1]|uniref:type VI secretion system Vgr family protein n=1 Tax=Pedobacter sp. W3I1 TaxID=3042291 RepID=UPI002788CC34|nr:phage baseplate assembly protein V [Pedobacter sp. W3I1]MDQ0636522.1 type VI secretion system secreted protein VgrG [Pedobacter sp. W3I1]